MEDESGIIGRFILLRKKLGPSQEKFGQLLGVSDVAISQIETGKIKLNEKHIKLISGVFSVSEEWFRSGEGPMVKPGKVLGEDKMAEIFEELSEDGRKMIVEYAKLILKNERIMLGEAGPDQIGGI